MAYVTSENLARFKTKYDAKLEEEYIAKEKIGEGLELAEDGTLSATGLTEVSWNDIKDQPKILTTEDVSNAVSDSIEAADLVTQDDLKTATGKVYKYQGSVDTYAELPTEGVSNGDVYNVDDKDGMNYAAVVSESGEITWDTLGSTIDLTGYVKTEDIKAMTNDDIDALFETKSEED
jgi:hypothetical protein